jgi:putative ABC transport system substrate-binding protein
VQRRGALAVPFVVLTTPSGLFAQTATRVYRIAILDEVSDVAFKETWGAFRDRLRELGYTEPTNLAFETRHAAGATERLPALASELVALKPDLIACAGTPPTRAAMRATSTIPIVFLSAGDPVASGLVATLSRPGRNVTGVSSLTTETGRKSLEMLLDLSPGAQRIAYLADPGNQLSSAIYLRVEEQARRLQRSIQLVDASTRESLVTAFETIRRERIQALLVGSSATVVEFRDDIIKFAANEKLPAVYGRLEYAPNGLLAYGIDRVVAASRAADVAQRILRGAKPADLPVEQSGLLKIVLNTKAARALGIQIPESIRQRADTIIE